MEKGSYTEEDAQVLVRKIVCAIEYLHGQNIAHRDLKVRHTRLLLPLSLKASPWMGGGGEREKESKVPYQPTPPTSLPQPENLLVKSVADDTEVKIADFGLSKIIDEQKMMQTACGTPGYVGMPIWDAAPLHPCPS